MTTYLQVGHIIAGPGGSHVVQRLTEYAAPRTAFKCACCGCLNEYSEFSSVASKFTKYPMMAEK